MDRLKGMKKQWVLDRTERVIDELRREYPDEWKYDLAGRGWKSSTGMTAGWRCASASMYEGDDESYQYQLWMYFPDERVPIMLRYGGIQGANP